ncbi:MAG: hypothetical protein CMF31_05650 [Kordiimonas sp.]|nr:hypothetical protein [Kordiimonas sp.]|tara:strand:+ start:1486 stop:1902 length:417 start_codon:yes stop_codon:yes gene_type:complete
MIEHVHALPEGYLLSQYEILGVLGAGGFGITYKTRDTSLDKLVAIKEYLPDSLAIRDATSEVTARSTSNKDNFDWGLNSFMNEAKVLAKFQHPNIVSVIQVFPANQTASIVMEYVEGQELSSIIAEQARWMNNRYVRS